MKEKESKVVDVQINWQLKTVQRPQKKVEEGLFAREVEGKREVSGDALEYMRMMIEHSGMHPDWIPGWQDCVRLTTEEVRLGKCNLYDEEIIPPHTLFLLVYGHYIDDDYEKGKLAGKPPTYFRSIPEAAEAIQQNPAAVELGQKIMEEERVFRVWLDVKEKHFPPDVNRDKFAKLLSRLTRRPKFVLDRRYHVSLGGMDLAGI